MIQKRWKLILFTVMIGIIIQFTYTSNIQVPITSIVETGESVNLMDGHEDDQSSSVTKFGYLPITLASLLIISGTLLDRRQKFMHFLSSVFYQSNYFRQNIVTSP
ncbi:hypothetical protein N783_10905 [Pontibacillus marinus BH030004 = DSM 16465]|uniref:Uncharacterized protein n=2 Tax=Pontibacillus TaxID=289201 RepID=A0A0A5GJC5_9BACI|nr:hypothetical protein N783_10905 [Pontibacillus marinus BH030004 = DSM 16465]